MATNTNENAKVDLENSRCNCKPSPPGKKGRNLVLCIDGTFHRFGEKNTHIIELYSQLEKDNDQLVFFDSGIGAYTTPSWWSFKYWKQVINYKINIAITWNLEKTVTSAYRWLVDNYQDGDYIYLFGSSRSAYQVHIIARMISSVGLMYGGNDEQIPFAYALSKDSMGSVHEATNESNQSPSGNDKVSSSKAFKNAFSREGVRVHFIGIWDADLAFMNVNGSCLPGLESGCFLRHAHVLDGRRLAECAHDGITGYERSSTQLSPSRLDSSRESSLESFALTSVEDLADYWLLIDGTKQGKQWHPPHIKRVCFTKSPSNLTGNGINGAGREPAFVWMLYEAVWAGLKQKQYGGVQ